MPQLTQVIKNCKFESKWVITNNQQTSQFMRGVLFFVDNKSKSPSSKGYPKKFEKVLLPQKMLKDTNKRKMQL